MCSNMYTPFAKVFASVQLLLIFTLVYLYINIAIYMNVMCIQTAFIVDI